MYVEKKHHFGCGVQCLSYVIGKPSSAIRKLTQDNYPDGPEIVSILKNMGFKIRTPFRSSISRSGRQNIVITPSLNTPSEFHFCVIWYDNGIKCWDPVKSKQKKRYVSRNKKSLQPNETIITSWTSVIEIIP